MTVLTELFFEPPRPNRDPLIAEMGASRVAAIHAAVAAIEDTAAPEGILRPTNRAAQAMVQATQSPASNDAYNRPVTAEQASYVSYSRPANPEQPSASEADNDLANQRSSGSDELAALMIDAHRKVEDAFYDRNPINQSLPSE